MMLGEAFYRQVVHTLTDAMVERPDLTKKQRTDLQASIDAAIGFIHEDRLRLPSEDEVLTAAAFDRALALQYT